MGHLAEKGTKCTEGRSSWMLVLYLQQGGGSREWGACWCQRGWGEMGQTGTVLGTEEGGPVFHVWGILCPALIKFNGHSVIVG